MRPAAAVGRSVRACGAIAVSSPAWNVFYNMLRAVVIGSWDSHCGVAVTGSWTVFVNNMPACRVGDINGGCPCPWPPHPPSPFVTGDYNVFLF